MAEKEYIERDRIVKFIETGLNDPDKVKAFGHDAVEILAEIHLAPAADVAPVVHARWDEDKYAFCNVCPECGLVIDRTCIKLHSGKLNYCPNCGAKMDGGKHGET